MKKWIKKINIFMCCLLLCFCSVVAKPKEVDALIGVDDLALATIGLMGLSLLGIGITENINENYDTYKKVALNTYNSMCDFVGQSWEDMCLSAYNTGQFALNQLNNVKSNIQDWYNSFGSGNVVAPWDSLGGYCANTRFVEDIDSIYNQMFSLITVIPKYDMNKTFLTDLQAKFDEFRTNSSKLVLCKLSSNQVYICYNNSKYNTLIGAQRNFRLVQPAYGDFKNGNFGRTEIFRVTFPYSEGGNYSYGQLTDLYTPEFYIDNISGYFYTNDKNIAYGDFWSSPSNYVMRINNKWVFNDSSELPVKGQNPLDGFSKLNDMVKGLDGVLDLDPISIGALNGTFEITDTTITNYGTISTAVLDLSNVHDDTYTFPLVGSLENTLDDTHTMIFNPTLDDDITNVGDITVTYPQNPSIPTLKDVDKIENIDDLKFDWTTVFPFCIPFDFIKFLKVLCSDPITPEVNWNYDLAGFKGTLNLSLKDYNDVASLLRKMETFSFILFLIFKTRELIRG